MASNAQNNAQAAALRSALAKLSPEEKAALGQKVIDSQFIRKQKPLYSTVRFQTTVTGAGPYTYAIAAGTQLIAFNYALTDPPSGFLAAYGAATHAETSLISKGEGGAPGAVVKIYGLSFQTGEDSDGELARQIFRNTWVDVTLNGPDRYMLLGPMALIPCAGGLYGAGKTAIVEGPQNAPTGLISMMSNGLPIATNFYKFVEPITWNPLGVVDSKFQVRFNVAHAISVTAAARAGVPASAITAYAPPAAAGLEGTYYDVRTIAHAIELQPRSPQQ